MNRLDIQRSLSVDKTGDTIASGYTIYASGTNTVGATGIVSVSGSMKSSNAAWSFGPTNATLSGGYINVKSSAIMTVTVASSLVQTASGGRIVLGDADWPTFSATRSITRAIDFGECQNIFSLSGVGTWTVGSNGLIAPAVAAPPTPADIVVPIHPPHDGATLQNVDIFFTPNTSPSRTPATNIAANILTRQMTSGGVLPTRSKWLTSDVAYTFPGAATYIDGKVKSVSVGTSLVFAPSTTQYALYLKDEGSTNAVGGTVFHGAIFTFSSIADLRCP